MMSCSRIARGVAAPSSTKYHKNLTEFNIGASERNSSARHAILIITSSISSVPKAYASSATAAVTRGYTTDRRSLTYFLTNIQCGSQCLSAPLGRPCHYYCTVRAPHCLAVEKAQAQQPRPLAGAHTCARSEQGSERVQQESPGVKLIYGTRTVCFVAVQEGRKLLVQEGSSFAGNTRKTREQQRIMRCVAILMILPRVSEPCLVDGALCEEASGSARQLRRTCVAFSDVRRFLVEKAHLVKRAWLWIFASARMVPRLRQVVDLEAGYAFWLCETPVICSPQRSLQHDMWELSTEGILSTLDHPFLLCCSLDRSFMKITAAARPNEMVAGSTT
eukprot:6188065-Pleurochrysis_carterae.AAC.2